jgi:hypothetical protein
MTIPFPGRDDTDERRYDAVQSPEPPGVQARGRSMKFNHVAIPTLHSFGCEIALPHLQMTVSDHLSNPFGTRPMELPAQPADPDDRSAATRCDQESRSDKLSSEPSLP